MVIRAHSRYTLLKGMESDKCPDACFASHNRTEPRVSICKPQKTDIDTDTT